MMKKLIGLYTSIVSKTEPLVLLVLRIVLGVLFLQSGLGKLRNLDHVIEFFNSLGIPAASIQAPFVAGLEFVGGICLLLGLLTRVMAAPLAVTMVVAIVTAKKDDVADFSSLIGVSEFLYILLLLVLVSRGPGPLSVDRKLKL